MVVVKMMTDSPTCPICGEESEPVFNWAGKLRAWLCVDCLWFDAPVGREHLINRSFWEKNSVREQR